MERGHDSPQAGPGAGAPGSGDPARAAADRTPKAPPPGAAASQRPRSVAFAKPGLKLLILLALVPAVWGLSASGWLSVLLDQGAVQAQLERLGWIGPAALVVLMALAVIISPLPNAPIALAAGAAYGPGWGTLYVLVGTELGSLLCFGIARLLGREAMERIFKDRLSLGHDRSQRALMAAVFAARLLPFVSFDFIGYAAGLTPLAWWRFALANLAGIVPASILLVYFGSTLAAPADLERILLVLALLGALALIPLAAITLRRRRHPGPAARRER